MVKDEVPTQRRHTYMVKDEVHLQEDGSLGAMYQLLVLQSVPSPLTTPDLQQLLHTAVLQPARSVI